MKYREPCAVTRPLMSEEVTASHAPSDPVEMRRLMYQTPAMVSHPPIPVSMLAQHIEMLKANDNLKFSQEYEVNFEEWYLSSGFRISITFFFSYIFSRSNLDNNLLGIIRVWI